MHRLLRAVATAVVVLLLASACDGVGSSPAGAPDAVGVVVPPAEPGGAAYGRVLHPDGTSVVGAALETSQPFDSNVATVSVTLATLGFVCLLDTEGDVCPQSHEADLGDDGLWQAAVADVDPAKALTATAYGPTDDADLSGPVTSVSVDAGAAPLRVPDLVTWEPEIVVRRVARGLRVSWSGGGEVPHGAKVSFDVYVQDADDVAGRPVRAVRDARGSAAVVPGWQVEDRPVQVAVVATTRAGGATYVYTTRQVAAQGGPVPVSRNAGCAAPKGAGLAAAATPCGLTDGDLDDTTEVRLPGQCGVDDPGGCDYSQERLCVDLGRARPVGLVVVRTPFLTDDDTVELSTDGRTFRTVGPLGDAGDDDTTEVHPVSVEPRARARYACVRSDFGFTGYGLSELSVWGP